VQQYTFRTFSAIEGLKQRVYLDGKIVWINSCRIFRLDIYRQTIQLVIFLPTFNAPCIRQKFDVTGTQTFFWLFLPTKQAQSFFFHELKKCRAGPDE
jgi:hypothetical protein